MINPNVPPMAVIIKIGAAVWIPFSITSLNETGVVLSN